MSFVVPLVNDLTAHVSKVTALGTRVVIANVLEDITAAAVRMPKPLAGVIYEGARANGTQQVGVSGESIFSVMILTDIPNITQAVNITPVMHQILDAIRHEVQGKRTPTGHFWKWVLEAPVSNKGGQSVWLQRWSSVMQLPPGKPQ